MRTFLLAILALIPMLLVPLFAEANDKHPPTPPPPVVSPAPSADKWWAADKEKHLWAGLIVSYAVTHATESAWKGLGAGCAVGAAKELTDSLDRKRHTPSWKDFAVTCLGAGVGALGGHVVLTHSDGTTRIAYARQFP